MGRMNRRRERIALVVLIALLSTIPIVGGLQYHLLTRASEAAAADMHRTIANAARQIRNEITSEVAGLVAILSTSTTGDRSLDELSQLYEAWSARARYPGLVDELAVVEGSGPDARLLAFDGDDRGFRVVSQGDLGWIERRSVWEDGSERTGSVANDPYLVVAPTYRIARRSSERAGAEARPVVQGAYTIYLRVDAVFLSETLLPVLLREYLGTDPRGFQAAVFDTASPEPVYATAEVSADDFVAEARAGSGMTPRFVADEITPLPFWLTSDAGFPGRPGLGPSDGATPPFVAGIGEGWLFEMRENRQQLSQAGLHLLLWHPSWSIERATRLERNQNLLVSYLVLLAFGAAATGFHGLFRRAQRLRIREHEFVASVTHELRTPISAMYAVAENLAEGIVTQPARVREYGAAILQESRRLRAMIDQTLVYAGLQTNDRPREEAIDLHRTVRRVAEAIPELGRTEFSVSVPSPAPALRGDATGLESILSNLLTNAVKHNPPGTPVTLSVTTEVTSRRSWLVLRVADQGSGIPRSELAHVCDPFFRGSMTQDRQIPGTGLGLNIVERIVTNAGGKLDIESSRGTGTVVTARLPVNAADG